MSISSLCGVCPTSPAVPSSVTATEKQKKVECEALNSVITDCGTWRVARWGAGDSHMILWWGGREGEGWWPNLHQMCHRRDRGCQMQSVWVVVTPPLQHLTLTTSPLAHTGSSTYLYTGGNVMDDTIYYLMEALESKAVIAPQTVCVAMWGVWAVPLVSFPSPLILFSIIPIMYNVLYIGPLLLQCQVNSNLKIFYYPQYSRWSPDISCNIII